MPRISLIGPSYPAYSKAVSVQQSMNLYLETVEVAEGKTKQVLRGRPGLTLFKNCTVIDAAATPIRGLWAGGGRLFVAAGTKFFELDVTGALVGSTSTIVNDGLPVDIIPNRNQLLVVSGGKVYYNNGLGLTAVTFPALTGTAVHIGGGLITWDSTPNGITGNTDHFDIGMLAQTVVFTGIGGGPYTVASIINPNLMTVTPLPAVFASTDWTCTPIMNAKRGAFIDGYYLVNRPSSYQFNISGFLDGSTWNGLDYDFKSGYPDNIQAVWTEPPLVYLLGTETMEIWRDTGRASFPLERMDGGFSRVGLAATWSPVSIMGRLHMLAGGGMGQIVAVRMNGVTPERISSYAMEQDLRSIVFPTQGVSFSYVEDGHLFWNVAFDTGAYTWVFDATEAQHRPPQECWHQRAAWSGTAFQDYIPRYHAFLPEASWNGSHIVGGSADGKLYIQSSSTYADDGSNICYVRALPYVYNEDKLLYHNRFEVEMETGTTTPVPTVQLDWSDDRGQTWGTGSGGAGTKLTLGPYVNGTYTTRFFAAGLGSSRGRVYRLTIIGKARIAVIDAVLDYEEGRV